MSHVFGTTVCCMDGRAVEAVTRWMKKSDRRIEYVDCITEPGLDGLLAHGKLNAEALAQLKAKLAISIVKHGSRFVSVVGHEDCAGNPVSQDEHHTHIGQSHSVIRAMLAELLPGEEVKLVGLYARPRVALPSWRIDQVV